VVAVTPAVSKPAHIEDNKICAAPEDCWLSTIFVDRNTIV